MTAKIENEAISIMDIFRYRPAFNCSNLITDLNISAFIMNFVSTSAFNNFLIQNRLIVPNEEYDSLAEVDKFLRKQPQYRWTDEESAFPRFKSLMFSFT